MLYGLTVQNLHVCGKPNIAWVDTPPEWYDVAELSKQLVWISEVNDTEWTS